MVRSDRPGLSSIQPAPFALTGCPASGSSPPVSSVLNVNKGIMGEYSTNPTSETDSPITLRGRFSPPGPGGRETPHVGAVLGNDQGIPKDQVCSQDRAREETRALIEDERGVEFGPRAATSMVTGIAEEAPESEDESAREYCSQAGSSLSPTSRSWICVDAPYSPTDLCGDAAPADLCAAACEPEVPGSGSLQWRGVSDQGGLDQ